MNAAHDVAAHMAEAATDLLASLDEQQRVLAAWPFPSDDERRRWFYTPTDHGGLPLGSMRPAQQRLAMRLLASGLSRPGYVSVSTIMALENVLDEVEGWGMTWGRERGRDSGLYYVRVFGTPAEGATWSWRFGGHHVSINQLVVEGAVAASTPCFLGADPASSPLLGPHLLRPLAGVEDLGRQLVRSLDEEQRVLAIVSPVPPVDLVGANRPSVAEGDLPLPLADVWRDRFTGPLAERVEAIQAQSERTLGLRSEHLEALRLTAAPKGLPAHRLRPDQVEVLQALLDTYVGRLPDALADAERARYTGDSIDRLAFAWAGDTAPGAPHYYRVQGPRLLAEYDNTQRGANHVHSVWRDPDGDFGADVLAAHYRQAHA